MNITVGDMIKAQLRLIGAIEKNETPTADEMNDALQANNMMLDSWSARNLLVRSTVLENFPLVAGTYHYTIGTGQTFNTTKPVKVVEAFYRDSSSIDQPIEVVSYDLYDDDSDKTVASGPPVELFYDPGVAQQATQKGDIYLNPVPDSAYTLYLRQQKMLTEFSSLTATVTFDPAYYRAIKFNGAMEIYREYHQHAKPLPGDLVALARESMRIVENMNAVPLVAGTDLPTGKVGGTYNIYSDSFD